MSLMMEEQKYAPIAFSNVNGNNDVVKAIAKKVKDNAVESVVLVARGTSNHAGLYFKYVVEATTGLRVSKFYHSVNTILHASQNMAHTLCVAVSQSGCSTDTIEVVKMAQKNGAITVGVTDDEASPIAKMCDYHLFLNCGEEKSVAATKTFTLELAVLKLLAEGLAGKELSDFAKIGEKLKEFLTKYDDIKEVALRNLDIDNLVVLSRGPAQFLAEELCLKLTETCYKLAKAFSVAEFAHGPFALLDESRQAILFAEGGAFTKDFIDIAKRIKGTGAKLIAFSDIPEVLALADDKIVMPVADDASPYRYAMALQCFAVNIAEGLGKNPDVPRGLKKVTITL